MPSSTINFVSNNPTSKEMLKWMQLVIVSISLCICNAIIEPYPPLHGGIWQNNSYLSQYSADPIINYIWDSKSINSSALQIYNVTPKYAYTNHQGSFSNLQSIYDTPENINVIIYGPGTITIDFGFENAAWFEIDSNDCTDNGLKMSISEYNQPITNMLSYPKTLTPIKYVNNGITTYRLETNKQLYEGVRYGFIHISNQTQNPWHIIGIRIISQIKPNNYIGSFQSNKYPMLNYIWYAAAYCVKMNMLPNTMGSILMERGDRVAIMGDSHISFRVALYVFGEFDYIAKNIIQLAPNTDGIMSYPLYWVESIYDYYLMTNDMSLLLKMEGYITKYLNQSISVFGKNPSINWYGWDDRVGSGFEAANQSPEAQYAYQMLTIQTIGKALIFFEKNALNNLDLYNYYASVRQTFINLIRNNSEYLNKFGLHSSSDAINGLWMTENETNYLFSKWFNDSVNICSWSPFNTFYIMTAIGNLKHINYLLSSLDLCWGNQIRLGATTFWEQFNPHYINFMKPNDPIPNDGSQCHPWSSGSLSIINQFIVGLKILKPGFEYIEIKPSLLQISAQIPVYNRKKTTQNDVISIDFDGVNGKYVINIPIQMEIDIYLPTINVNYLPKLNDKYLSTDKIKIITITHEKFSYFMLHFEKNELTVNKNYHFQIVSNQTKITIPNMDIPNVFPPQYYPCFIVNKDFETHGNWINKYGAEGYILFGYQSATKNVINLPKWVISISAVAEGKVSLHNWVQTTSDIRALQNPNSPSGQRALGAIYSNHSASQPPTYGINIEINEAFMNNLFNSSYFYMSIYICDWTNEKRTQSMHVFDMKSLNLITPIVYDENYANGLWITLKLDRSTRIRFMLGQGPSDVLSGIFFDSHPPLSKTAD